MAGSFNEWKPEDLKQKEDGEWAANLKIGPGTHLYKCVSIFLVFLPLIYDVCYILMEHPHNIRYVVDGEWLVDPSKEMVTDSKGNTNNVVVVDDNRVTKCQREVGQII